MALIKLNIFKPWMTKRITELAGFEDDVLLEYVFTQLEEKEVDPRKLQLYLTGFMQKNAKIFVKELWELMVDAQTSPSGIPTVWIEAKSREMERQRVRGWGRGEGGVCVCVCAM